MDRKIEEILKYIRQVSPFDTYPEVILIIVNLADMNHFTSYGYRTVTDFQCYFTSLCKNSSRMKHIEKILNETDLVVPFRV